MGIKGIGIDEDLDHQCHDEERACAKPRKVRHVSMIPEEGDGGGIEYRISRLEPLPKPNCN